MRTNSAAPDASAVLRDKFETFDLFA